MTTSRKPYIPPQVSSHPGLDDAAKARALASGKVRRPYTPPEVISEPAFETAALACSAESAPDPDTGDPTSQKIGGSPCNTLVS